MNGSENGPTLFLGLSILEWIALVGIVSLMNSVFWEWGYWGALGVSFGEIPISLTDIADNVAWVPVFIIPVIGSIVLSVFTRRVEGFKSEEEILRGTRFPRLVKIHREAPFILIFLMIFAGVFFQAYMIGKVQPILIFFVFLVLWGYFIPWVFNHSRAWNSTVLYFLCCFVPVLFMLSYAIGREMAGNTIAEHSPASVFLKIGESIQEKQLILLRNNHTFVYAYDSENKILLTIPWSSIARIGTESIPDFRIRIPFIPRYNDGKAEEKKK